MCGRRCHHRFPPLRARDACRLCETRGRRNGETTEPQEADDEVEPFQSPRPRGANALEESLPRDVCRDPDEGIVAQPSRLASPGGEFVGNRSTGRGRDGPSPRRARTAPRTDPSEQHYRTGLLPRVRTSKRSSGQGCVTRGRGSHRCAMAFIRSQFVRSRWLRRRSACSQWRTT